MRITFKLFFINVYKSIGTFNQNSVFTGPSCAKKDQYS